MLNVGNKSKDQVYILILNLVKFSACAQEILNYDHNVIENKVNNLKNQITRRGKLNWSFMES